MAVGRLSLGLLADSADYAPSILEVALSIALNTISTTEPSSHFERCPLGSEAAPFMWQPLSARVATIGRPRMPGILNYLGTWRLSRYRAAVPIMEQSNAGPAAGL